MNGTLQTVSFVAPKLFVWRLGEKAEWSAQIWLPGNNLAFLQSSIAYLKPGLVTQVCNPHALEDKKGESRDLRPALAT